MDGESYGSRLSEAKVENSDQRKVATMANSTTNLLTAEEAAKYLRLHVKSIYRLAREGKIPGRKIGGSWRFHQASLEQWLTKGKDASLLLLEGET
jgi:excisionase family DNA binding protein